jgi:hypothetical protein
MRTGFGLPCGTREFNDRLLTHVMEPTPTALILPSDHPGQRRDEAEVGENMLILSFSWSEAAAASGWGNDCDLNGCWRYNGRPRFGICAAVVFHV